MAKSAKMRDCKVERLVPAPPEKAYDAWLDPENPGSPWHVADKLILNPTVDGSFYWLVHGTTHYGRFTKVERPNRVQHTWVSPNTFGQESTVTVTFKRKGVDTLMTLVHANLPDAAAAKAHREVWTDMLEGLAKQFGTALRRRTP